MSKGEDGAVVAGDGIVFREHDVGACSAVGAGCIEVAGVGVCGEDHVADVVCDAIILVGGAIVEELVDAALVVMVALACWEPISLRATRSLLSTAWA